MIDYNEIYKLYQMSPEELESSNKIKNLYSIGMELAGDLDARPELDRFISVFKAYLQPEELGDIFRKIAHKEAEWVEENIDMIKEKNDSIYKNYIELKENPNLPVSNLYNRRVNTCKAIEMSKVVNINKALKDAKADIKNSKTITTLDGNKRTPMNMGAANINYNGKVVHYDSIKKEVIKTRDKAVKDSEKKRNVSSAVKKRNEDVAKNIANRFSDDEYYFDDE